MEAAGGEEKKRECPPPGGGGVPWPPSALAVGPSGSYMLCVCMCDFQEVLLYF